MAIPTCRTGLTVPVPKLETRLDALSTSKGKTKSAGEGSPVTYETTGAK